MASYATYIVLGNHHWQKNTDCDIAFEQWFSRAVYGSYHYGNEVWIYRVYGEDKDLVNGAYIDGMGGLCYHNSLQHQKVIFKLPEKESKQLLELNEKRDELLETLSAPFWNDQKFWKD